MWGSPSQAVKSLAYGLRLAEDKAPNSDGYL
jgi:hypothetical protein